MTVTVVVAALAAAGEYQGVDKNRLCRSVPVNPPYTLFELHWIPGNIEMHELEHNINDDGFAHAMAEKLMEYLGGAKA